MNQDRRRTLDCNWRVCSFAPDKCLKRGGQMRDCWRDSTNHKGSMANFTTWTQENLAQFAQEAVAKMTEQHEQIQQLQCDLKDAIEAYRVLIVTPRFVQNVDNPPKI